VRLFAQFGNFRREKSWNSIAGLNYLRASAEMKALGIRGGVTSESYNSPGRSNTTSSSQRSTTRNLMEKAAGGIEGILNSPSQEAIFAKLAKDINPSRRWTRGFCSLPEMCRSR